MNELKSNTEYTARVAARNVVGYSEFTVRHVSTDEAAGNTELKHFMLLALYSKDHKNFHWCGISLGELCLLGQKVTTPPFGIILAVR